jgi:peptidoglycan/xylan/chitin deacetylase (PgdA/CDA1 family)
MAPAEVQVTPDPDELRAAAAGCVPHAPAPLPGVLLGGKYRDSSLPVPNEVALTFDDGPTPESTPYVLDILERTHTPATFFVEGQWITKSPDLLRREWNDGFAIGNHSWDHPFMAQLTQDQLNHQFGDTQAAIQQILGPHACTWLYRPPYASFNDQVLRTAQSYGLSTITWDDGSLDWGVPRPSPQDLAHRVLVSLHPGAVILFHDGPARHPHTEQAIPLVLQGLLARGYLPVTLPRLLADMHYPGVVVDGAPPPPPLVPPDLLQG